MAEATSASRGGTLNIVFHGTCAYLLDGTIRAIIPDVANYTIVAGTFLNEQPLKKGARYRLKGVNKVSGPAARISTDANLFLVGASLRPDAAIFCELHLPQPASFRSLRCMDVEKEWFPSQIALVHVLSYDFEDHAELVILDRANDRFPWEPKFDRKTKTVNLHVYSDPAAGAPPEKLPAFKVLMDLFGQDVALDLDAAGPFVSPPAVYPEIRGLEEPLEIQDYNNSRPERAAEEPPYSCTHIFGIATGQGATTGATGTTGSTGSTGPTGPAGDAKSRVRTAPASLGYSVSVKGEPGEAAAAVSA
jgi:hypothetical protein